MQILLTYKGNKSGFRGVRLTRMVFQHLRIREGRVSMAKRHRQRTEKKPSPANIPLANVKHYMVAPSAPGATRPGIDVELVVALQEIDRLISDMRNGLNYPNQAWNEETAVQRYLLYISMLIDVVLAEFTMSALHSNDMMLIIKQRLLIEYAAKSAYYDEHPDYALFMMTIDRAKQRLKKLRKANADASKIAEAKQHHDEMIRRFPSVASMERLTFDDVMAHYGDADDYVWLYAAPSAILHGDPDGIDVLIETLPDGTQRPHLTLPLEQVNAMLVDAASNTLMFCDHFIGRFRPGEDAFLTRLKSLWKRIHELVLKHPFGRDDDALEAIRAALSTD